MATEEDITRLLRESGKSPEASERLYALVYDELKRVARRQLGAERPGHTLQATALTNEAYLKLVDQTRVDWQNRAHFFAIASRAMRRILVDHARGRLRLKRGAGGELLPLEFAEDCPAGDPDSDLVALDEALTRLREEDAVKCQVVEMRYFAGMRNDEIARALGVTSRTVERHWRYARAWLFRRIRGSETTNG